MCIIHRITFVIYFGSVTVLSCTVLTLFILAEWIVDIPNGILAPTFAVLSANALFVGLIMSQRSKDTAPWHRLNELTQALGIISAVMAGRYWFIDAILDQHQAYILLSLPVSAVFLGMMVVIFGFPLANKFVMHSQPCKCKG